MDKQGRQMKRSNISPSWLREQVVGMDMRLETPFGSRLMLYADYTASGRGLHFIEDYLKQLMQLYANSHTEDDASGRASTKLLHQAAGMIKQAVNAGSDGRLVATGTGATGAIDRMQQLIGVKLPAASRFVLQGLYEEMHGKGSAAEFEAFCRAHQPVVFVGPYEHHSNEISWREGLATVVEVRLDEEGGVDLDHLQTLLQVPEYQGRLRIGSFSAASNVTGMRTPVHEIARLLHRHHALAFFDYAASAPYVEIDMNPPATGDGDASLDAVFISPHKFLGGPGASGILVFNTRCYHGELPPSMAGGGTVDYVGPKEHDFIEDIETRESAGTPGILQLVKAALAFEVKQAVGSEQIESRELEMTRKAFARWLDHPGIEILGNPDPARRIGIVSFNIRRPSGSYLHPRFVTCLLNDLFGVQSRAGCSCAGPYGHKLLGIADEVAQEYRAVIAEGHCGIKPGWCRVGFHYIFDEAEVDYLITAVERVAEHGHLFLPLYHFDPDSGQWRHKDTVESEIGLSLQEAVQAEPSGPVIFPAPERAVMYARYLEEARALAEELALSYREDEVKLEGEEGFLQSFQLPRSSLL
jgi:selenocysteine lyase/cysteine desulfurase